MSDVPLPPPGDTRFDDSDPRFRERSERDLKTALDASRPSTERLAAIMVLVYQVRCSFLHGNKNPNRDRDNQLVHWGVRVLEAILASA
jgi:hypothetical protein